MLTEYLNAALKKAEYKKIDDGTWYANILGFTGVWANADSVEECRNELLEVLEEWLTLNAGLVSAHQETRYFPQGQGR
jgi:predicted RNase H-like HicB family nuclease